MVLTVSLTYFLERPMSVDELLLWCCIPGLLCWVWAISAIANAIWGN